MTILITGATGVIGSEVTRQLLAMGIRPRLLVRNPEKASALAGKVDLVQGDLGDARSVQAAMNGVTSLFLLAPGPDVPVLEKNAITAARNARVGHIVKLSVAAAESEALALARWHRESEKAIVAAEVPYTFIRPVNFMSNTLLWRDSIRAQGLVSLPLGEGKSAYIDPVDVAAVAVRALLDGAAHHGREYVLTGPELLTTAEMVAIISAAIGRPARFVDVPLESFRQQLVAMGTPEAMVTTYVELYGVMRAGQLAFVSPGVDTVLGRKPGSFAAWVQRNAAAFR